MCTLGRENDFLEKMNGPFEEQMGSMITCDTVCLASKGQDSRQLVYTIGRGRLGVI